MNIMVGFFIGLILSGYISLCYFERLKKRFDMKCRFCHERKLIMMARQQKEATSYDELVKQGWIIPAGNPKNYNPSNTQ